MKNSFNLILKRRKPPLQEKEEERCLKKKKKKVHWCDSFKSKDLEAWSNCVCWRKNWFCQPNHQRSNSSKQQLMITESSTRSNSSSSFSIGFVSLLPYICRRTSGKDHISKQQRMMMGVWSFKPFPKFFFTSTVKILPSQGRNFFCPILYYMNGFFV